jgi:uncharacterized protein (TIGR00303 family)
VTAAWLERYGDRPTQFACVLGFTETGLVPGISAAGATPADRAYTAIADAEFLVQGPQSQPRFPLPPLLAGASPVLITRAVLTGRSIPLHVFDAGLRHAPTVPCIDLGGTSARCVSTGAALPLSQVQHLFQQGLQWGSRLAQALPTGYLILGECVVGGTTTALGVLLGLGFSASGMVNSSHSTCNHGQKLALVQQGLAQIPLETATPLQIVAAVGDPMQAVVAGMAIAAAQHSGVLLAGGTQMLAVYALARAIAHSQALPWPESRIVVGTTRWVADDPTGDTVGLATLLRAPLLATQLTFAQSSLPELRAYEQGYVKEGVGAGGCAIAAHLHGWDILTLRQQVELQLIARRAAETQNA